MLLARVNYNHNCKTVKYEDKCAISAGSRRSEMAVPESDTEGNEVRDGVSIRA